MNAISTSLDPGRKHVFTLVACAGGRDPGAPSRSRSLPSPKAFSCHSEFSLGPGTPPCHAPPAISILSTPSGDVPAVHGSPAHSCPGPSCLGRFFAPCALRRGCPMADQPSPFQFEEVPLDGARRMGRGPRMEPMLYETLGQKIQTLSSEAVCIRLGPAEIHTHPHEKFPPVHRPRAERPHHYRPGAWQPALLALQRGGSAAGTRDCRSATAVTPAGQDRSTAAEPKAHDPQAITDLLDKWGRGGPILKLVGAKTHG
jgi:hypothetical protein